ncbi:hypothetical protein P2A57_23030 [Xanthomonas perforans]
MQQNLNEIGSAMLRFVAATCVATGFTATGWQSIGPDEPIFAIVVQALLMAWAAFAITERFPPWTSKARSITRREVALLRFTGVAFFGRLLDVIGWNGMIARERGYETTRKGMLVLEEHTRRSELAHQLCAVAGFGLAALALLSNALVGAAWLAASTLIFQLYPMLLQRLVRARTQQVTTGRLAT